MSPPIPVSDLPSSLPPTEHHYTLDHAGKPIELLASSSIFQVDDVIYIAPSSEKQFHEIELGDQQLDFLEEMIENAEIKNTVISLNKMRRKLFRENGLLKKRMATLEQENHTVRHELDYLYQMLNLKKGK